MFCIQCEQTIQNDNHVGCTFAKGNCGKTAETSDLQDLLVATIQSLSAWALKAREYEIIDQNIDALAPRAYFSTLTNVNFDSNRIIEYAQEVLEARDVLKKACQEKNPAVEVDHPLASLTINDYNLVNLTMASKFYALNRDEKEVGEDVLGLRLLCLYGLKGAAAYMEHAHVLGEKSTNVYTKFYEIMSWLGTNPSDIDALFNTSMEIGKMNFEVMALLDKGMTEHYGDPIPTSVNTGHVKGKAILISGHDLKDLDMLLKQTEGTGINVYTHGEMLPAHGYPELKKYKHLVGNYGSGWQNQQTEFANFPGPIIMTSNCIISPEVGHYTDRIWTRSIVGWPNAPHLVGEDFSAVIDQALKCDGFQETTPEKLIVVGFGRRTLTDSIDPIIDLVSAGKLKHVYVIGGCDGAKSGRNYYTEFAEVTSKDSLILTLGCGKFRFNYLDLGTLEGLPRVLDIGQCNDSYSAIILAVKLAEKLGCGINDLPLSIVLSWFEQKAIVVLLTLLSLGVKNIYTGPTAPAFLTPNLLAILNDKFGLNPTGTVEGDMAAIMNRK